MTPEKQKENLKFSAGIPSGMVKNEKGGALNEIGRFTLSAHRRKVDWVGGDRSEEQKTEGASKTKKR